VQNLCFLNSYRVAAGPIRRFRKAGGFRKIFAFPELKINAMVDGVYPHCTEPCMPADRSSTKRGVSTLYATATLSIAAAVTCCAAATARAADELYRTQAMVTGQGEANRIVGFASCLEDVLIKVSGAQKLAGDSRLEAYRPDAGGFVTAFTYHDQMSGKPKRDEQGTRDRPFDLIVDFDQAKIDGILKALGLRPWVSHRPVLTVFVGMRQGARDYILTADAGQTSIQRDALLAAAAKRGMSVVLPSQDALAKSAMDAAKLETTPSASLAPLLAGQGGEVVLAGWLVWDDKQLRWAAQWRMDWQGRPHRWPVQAVTFDEVFRQGIGGAAQILSSNGDPG
jgi:hypothetical protein